MFLIDFEYAFYNYRAFDIANHFCEYAGFECDYSRWDDVHWMQLRCKHMEGRNAVTLGMDSNSNLTLLFFT